MMTNGFVVLPRKIAGLPMWEKPNYYIKVFLYLYFNANYTDSDCLKRGQVIADLDLLAKMCSSGTGSSTERHSARDIQRAIKFFCSDESGLHNECETVAKNKMLVTLSEYDKFTNSWIDGCNNGFTTDEERKKPTIIIYNNNTNNNEPVRSRPKSAFKVKPTAFSNFKAREKNFDEVKQKAKEKLRRSRNEQS